MNEEKARKILGDMIGQNNWLCAGSKNSTSPYVGWAPVIICQYRPSDIELDGTFSLKQIQAIAWWMENKKEIRK